MTYSWQQIGSDIEGELFYDMCGFSISFSDDGSIVAVSSIAHETTMLRQGSVRIFEKNNNNWEQVGNEILGETGYDYSGRSISLSSDGSVIAIGTEYNDGGGSNSGHVRIFQNVNGTWTQLGGDIDGEAVGSQSGVSVNLSADGTVVAIAGIGGDFDTSTGSLTSPLSGHVRILKYVTHDLFSGWFSIGNDIDGEAWGDAEDISVSLSSDGSIVAIGATGNDGNGYQSGHVRIYQNVNNTWTQIGSDIDGDASLDYSGHSVSLSADGTVVAIGSIYADAIPRPEGGIYNNTGHVRIFRNVGDSWIQVGDAIDGLVSDDSFGYSVSLTNNGSVVAIGAPYNDDNGSSSGQVSLYQNINDTWNQIGNSINGQNTGDESGYAVSLAGDGSVVAVGAPMHDPTENDNRGHVRIYQVDLIPIVSGPSELAGSTTSSKAIQENSTTVHTFTANETVTWSLSGGTDQELFTIDSSTGALSFKTAPDYENPTDSDTNNSYLVTVRATDGIGNSFDQTLTTTVTDIADETAPSITGPSGSVGDATSTISIEENTTAVHTFTANESVTWSLSGGTDQPLFDIDSSTGVLTFKSASDFENPTDSDSNNSYVTTVRATDTADNASDQIITTIVTDVDETSISLTELQALTYVASNPDLIAAFGTDTDSAIAHYTNYGQSEGRSIDAFNATNYLANYADLATAFGSDTNAAIRHYITSGYGEGRTDSDSGGDGDAELTEAQALSYIASNQDLISAFGVDTASAISHYTNYGQAEGRSTNSFDAYSYLASHSDLLNAFKSNTSIATKHYIMNGYTELRSTDSFDEWSYIASHTDLINVFGLDGDAATQHFVNHGYKEGRIQDNFDELGYLASNTDLIASLGSDTTAAIKHYISTGFTAGLQTDTFDVGSYIERYSDIQAAFGYDPTSAIRHYISNGFAEGRTDA